MLHRLFACPVKTTAHLFGFSHEAGLAGMPTPAKNMNDDYMMIVEIRIARARYIVNRNS